MKVLFVVDTFVFCRFFKDVSAFDIICILQIFVYLK